MLVLAACLAVGRGGVAQADGGCLTREQAITLIAHKTDVERPGLVSKWRIWAIADRESGLTMCVNGWVKVSPTGDVGLLQMHRVGGVWSNCLVNRWCHRPDLISDPEYQIDVMLNYAERYGDLCPWNPNGDYLPGCGYR